jgi:hypothetical protein
MLEDGILHKNTDMGEVVILGGIFIVIIIILGFITSG